MTYFTDINHKLSNITSSLMLCFCPPDSFNDDTLKTSCHTRNLHNMMDYYRQLSLTNIRQTRFLRTDPQHPMEKTNMTMKPPIPISEYIRIINMSAWSPNSPKNHCFSKNVQRPTARMAAPESFKHKQQNNISILYHH